MPMDSVIEGLRAKTASRTIEGLAEAVRKYGARRTTLRHSEVNEKTQTALCCTSLKLGASQQRSTSPQVQNQDQGNGAAGTTAQSVAPSPQQGPNLSFNRTRHGVRPWPRGAVVHHAPRGQGRTPRHAG